MSSRVYICGSWLIPLVLLTPGCNADATVRDSISANDPGRVSAHVGPPPVPPGDLQIMPSASPPTASPAVAPQPILPMMDQELRTLEFPAGAGPTLPVATQPADIEKTPYGKSAPGATQPAPNTPREGGTPLDEL